MLTLIRLMAIPSFLALLAAIVAVVAWGMEIPQAPMQLASQMIAALEANVSDAELRWAKTKEIVGAAVAVGEARRGMLVAGLDVYRWTSLLLVLLSSLQVWLTYEWWKNNRYTSFGPPDGR